MFYQLPPVGNPVRLSDAHDDDLVPGNIFQPYTAEYFDSGTAALAASILAAISLKGTDRPEVILPAYGCPDLVSAVVFAGAQPVLVDLEADRPWMNPDEVAAKITGNTVAVIAASLCGIPERLSVLRQLTEPSGVLLIEDSAQWFPGSIAERGWQGDMVILSFGRGKPVSLLGGGVVLFRDERFAGLFPDRQALSVSRGRQLAFRGKASIYNALISPRIYWILQWLPFLHIGETRYQPLEALASMDPVRLRLLGANISRYLQQNTGKQHTLSDSVDALADERIVNLPVSCGVPAQQRLLRYPLLIDAALRDSVFDRLSESGMGASIMYPGILPAIPGLASLLAGQGPFPEAESFSSRLLTLPVHGGVRHADIEMIAAQLRLPGI